MSDAPSGEPRALAEGWYDDPDDATQLRYWGGSAWTDHRAPKQAPPPPAAPQGTPERTLATWGVLGGGVLAVIGALMPWVVIRAGFAQGSVAGIEGDGGFSGVAGLVLIATGIAAARRGHPARFEPWISGVAAGVILLVTWYHLLGGGIASEVDSGMTAIGSGLYVTGLAGGVAALAALTHIGEAKTATRAS